jgi:hypothetical protein
VNNTGHHAYSQVYVHQNNGENHTNDSDGKIIEDFIIGRK